MNANISDIFIKEVPTDELKAFWKIHFKYLVDDGIITDDEDKEYFQSKEYRGIIEEHMKREIDRHHVVYFFLKDTQIGAAQYNTYHGEGGKCFILDFWIFPEYRNKGLGHTCFRALESYTKVDGALYYEINSEKEDSVRFWKSVGFVENGVDEYGDPLWIYGK